MRSRNDSSARSRCGSTISSDSHRSAGASSSASSRRRDQAARASSGMRSGGGETDGPLRIEAEVDAVANLQVGVGAGLRQRDTQLLAALQLAQQYHRVGAVKQQ